MEGETKFELEARNETSKDCPVRSDQYALTVRHAQLVYADVLDSLMMGRKPTTQVVLDDFNMTVEKGHIYGLLGSSGCGKTSILRAIVGQNDLTAGEIRVLGHKPKAPSSGIPGTTVGYMPQEISLLDWLSITEILHYYGQIVGMRNEEINAQIDNLSKLLDLPKTTRIIATLSGGQQRRVSFAIALLHSPPVLILDEPTVGVDPLLRENIWEYMTKLVKTKRTTIVITTHYIEEATQADSVGLMRNGKLMAEDNPKKIMQSLHCKNLEEVLYKLCLLQSSKNHSPIVNPTDLAVISQVKDDEVTSFMGSWVGEKTSPITRLRALLRKNMISTCRYYSYPLMLLLLAFGAACLLCLTTGGTPKNIHISVFNDEENCFSDGVISANLYTNSNGSVDCAMPANLTCRILGILQDKQMIMVPVDSEESAIYQVRKGRAWAAMMFKENFTASLMQRVHYKSLYDVDDNVIDTGTVRVTMDSSDVVISLLVQEQIFLSLRKVLWDLDEVCHTFKHTKDLPIKYNDPIYGGTGTNYLDYVIPGLVASVSMMAPLTYTLSLLQPERLQGTLERSLVAGVTMAEVMLSLFISCMGPVIILVIILMITPYMIFQRCMLGSFWTMFLVCGNIAITGMLLGFLLALVCPTIIAAILCGTGFYFACLLTCGSIWPVEGAYRHIQGLFWCLPMTLPTAAVREIALRGWGLSARTVLWSLASTTTWNIAFIAALFMFLRLKRNRV